MDRTEVTVVPPAPPASPRITYKSKALTPEDIADRLAAVEETYRRGDLVNGVCVVDGFGVSLTVESGALQVKDGVGPHRRVRRFERATHGLRRVVLLNSTGLLTINAINWCANLGVGLVVLGPDGLPQLASTPRAGDDARLRRMQAHAPELPVGLDVARSLIEDKLLGQARVLTTRFAADDPTSTLLELAGALGSARTIDEVRQIEATAASIYWQSWIGRPEAVPRFAARARIPSHWSRYEGRRSVLASGNGNRKAERPTNALLSYLFALLEIEAVLAAQVVGLDPGLGLIHLDTKGRQSLALDLVEPVRPEVEGFVLDLLESRTFRKSDFVETAEGHVRLMAPLTHDLAETMPRWAELLAPVAERVAHRFGQAMAGKYQSTTPLTRRRNIDAAAAVKARKTVARGAATSTSPRQRASKRGPSPLWSCPECGAPVANRHHVRCPECIAKDPRQTPAVRAKRAEAISARKRALRDRDDAGLPQHCDAAWYRREVLPSLAGVKLREIMEAAGCSKGFASVIRAGKYLPHVSTWRALSELSPEIEPPGNRVAQDVTQQGVAVTGRA